jgi:hypothetical protein
MGALVATTPTRTGTASPGAVVASSDTISRAILGTRGAILEILNGNASADSMTISDASTTKTGAAAAANTPSIPAGQNRAFLIRPEQADRVTNNVTITHSVTATVTYKLYRLG